jgi:hypothetical protein
VRAATDSSGARLVSCSQLLSHGGGDFLSLGEEAGGHVQHVQRGSWVCEPEPNADEREDDYEDEHDDDDIIFREASNFIVHKEPISPAFLFRHSSTACRRLLLILFAGSLEIGVRYAELVDSLMHLAVHAGEEVVADACVDTTSMNSFVARLILKHGHGRAAPDRCELKVGYGGIAGANGVYCVRMPANETFMVRRNGCAVWTGNSRAANGPVVLLTRQPAEGRARDGGLRLGEMEMECLWAHGTMGFLKERFMECSDNYRLFVCKCCGMMAHANPESNLFYCKSCKNLTEFSELRIPYASKLLVQEVETMAIATRFVTDA